MPSSHGGGSSGGGFHGGGGFSGGGGGNRGPRFSTRNSFPGARRYYYTNRFGRTCFFYYAGAPVRQSLRSNVFMPLIFILLGLAISAAILYSLIPHKLAARYVSPTGVYINDKAGILNNDATLKNTLETFYEKTGVEPYVYTFSASEFNTSVYGKLSASSLENYAYTVYVNTFDDEGHWLIMIAAGEAPEDWIWCDMAGDDTKRITDDIGEDFQKDLQKYLSKTDVSYEGALNKAFENATYNATHLSGMEYAPIVFVVIFFLVWTSTSAVSLVNAIKRSQTINEYCDYRDKRGGRDFYEGMPQEGEHVTYTEFTSNDNSGRNASDGSDLFD